MRDGPRGDGVYMVTVRFLIRAMAVLMLAGVGAVFPTAAAWACTCTAQSDQEHYAAASVVFTGRAVAQREDGRFIAFAFEVDDVSKGMVSDGVEVRATTVDVEGCGLAFDAKTRYQVFAYLDNGVLMTGLCTGSHVISDQQPVVPAPGTHLTRTPTAPSATPEPLPAETTRPPASVPPGPQTPSATPSSSPTGSAAAPIPAGGDASDADSSTGWLVLLAGVLALCLAGLGFVVTRRRRQ